MLPHGEDFDFLMYSDDIDSKSSEGRRVSESFRSSALTYMYIPNFTSAARGVL